MNQSMVPTIQAAATAGILEHTRHGGGDVGAVLRDARLSLDDFARPENRLPLPSFVRLIEAASRATGDDWFGAHLGQSCPLGALGLPGHLASLAPTVERALATFARHYPLLGEATDVRFQLDEGQLSFTYRVLDEGSWPRRQDAEQVLTMVVSLIRSWVDPRWAPELVWFEHAPPGSTAEIERILGCPVRFNCPTNTIWLDAAAASQGNPHGDPAAFQLLSWFAERVGETPPASTFAEQVVATIERCAQFGDPGIEPVARALGLEPRTLQRRLRAAHTSFRELHERYRRAQSFALLQSSELTPKEIAHRLGYATPSAFIRAFRRWSPTTPARFRDERRVEPAHGGSVPRGASWPTW